VGTQSTVAQAQAERLRRQQERERLTAAKKLQKIWRSHATRQRQKQKWREEWDAIEQERLHQSQPVHYEDVLDSGRPKDYGSSEQLLAQLRLLVFFLDVRIETDLLRMIYFGSALDGATHGRPSLPADRSTARPISRYGMLISKALDLLVRKNNDRLMVRLLTTLETTTRVIATTSHSDARVYFKSVLHVLVQMVHLPEAQSPILGILSSILDEKAVAAYIPLADEMLRSPALATSNILQRLGLLLDQQMLAEAIMRSNQNDVQLHAAAPSNIDDQLWRLSYLVYFYRKASSSHSPGVQHAWIQATSMLLGECANEISSRIDIEDQPMQNTKNPSVRPLPGFVRDNITWLGKEASVKENIYQIGKSARQVSNSSSSFAAARQLANYAVALLRAFPGMAMKIRMWLYTGSIASTNSAEVSVIQYFWEAAKDTSVFKKIAKDQRTVLSILREPAPQSNQFNHSPVSAAETKQWQDEWRIILLFLELYTFILKIMDDEEFFALQGDKNFHVSMQTFHSRKGSLPMQDVARMTTFLKNLAFTLYWNAADLVDTNEIEELGGISVFFGNAPQLPARTAEKPKQQTLAGNGVSQAYMKGLSTGLLRMLHERDSRRKFLSDNHWLMTNQFDMMGFIPAVVAEEEKRHEYGDDVDDEDDEDDEYNEAAEPNQSIADSPETGGRGASVQLLQSVFGIRQPHTSRTQSTRQAELLAKRREHARKRRQLESLAPRLEILRNLPFFIPFDTRVQIFREFVYRDQLRRRDGYVDPDHWRMSVARNSMGRGPDGRPQGMDALGKHHAEIHRESVLQDAFEAFYPLGEALKEPIQISFIDKFGAPEAGIDGGGVTKEFLMSVTSESFDPTGEMSFFIENAQHFLSPNPTILEQAKLYLRQTNFTPRDEYYNDSLRTILKQYEFLGRIIGKCLYEGILVDVVFAGFFLLKWALTGGTTTASRETAYRASINDVREFDEELYQGLLKLKNYPGDVEADFSLNFTITDEITFKDDRGDDVHRTITKDLVTGGSNMAVTNANRLVYIDQVVRYRLQRQQQDVTNAFLRGLGQIIQPMWLAMFNQKELQKLVGGDNTEVDVSDLRRNTQYGGLYVIGDDGLEHPTVELFWKVLYELDDVDRRKVLKFVTSTPRAPLLGFGHLNPKFSIRDSSEDVERLPSTSTCVNLLKLPRYKDEKTMREKLLYAVNSGAGFDLS